MKKSIIYTITALFSLSNASGQQHEIMKRAIKKQDFNVKEFTVDGIRVLFKPSDKEIISASLYIKGGTENYSKEQEGIENLTMNMLAECGSEKYPKDTFNSLIDSYGTTITVNSGLDMSSVDMNCIKSHWDASWNIFADLILHPSFDETTFRNKRDEAIAAIHQTESDPDGHLNEMVMSQVFKNTRYAKIVQGTEATLNGLTFHDITKYYNSLIEKGKLFVVIIGNLSEEEVKARIAMLKGIHNGGTPLHQADEKPSYDSSTIYKEDRKLATNYIEGIMDAPAPGTTEHTAMKIAMNILRDRLFVEIRTKRNLSYAPSAFLASLKIPYCAVYVTTTDPDQAVQVITDEIKKIRKDGFSEKELQDKKEKYLTGYYMNLETNSALNGTLGKNENLGSWKEALNVLEQVNNLTLQELNNVFGKYTRAIHWVYLGDTSAFDDKVFLQSLD